MTYTILQVVTNNYDKVYECIDLDAAARILFTDNHSDVANWEQHIINTNQQFPWEDIFKYRWNPFDYVDTDYVVWVDGSIKITGSLKSYVNDMEAGNYDFATLKHPKRNNIFDEYCEWIISRHYPKKKAFQWMAYMEKSGYKPSTPGLYQVNVCIFKNTPIVRQFGETVWSMLHIFDKDHAERLDQTIATYVLNHIYKDRLSILPLSEDIYQRGTSLKIHGVHPNR